MNNKENVERQIIGLIAADRIDIPISSMSGKLKRMKPKLAEEIAFPGSNYQGERVYARIEEEDKMKARTTREAINEFKEAYPTHGKVLEGLIAEKRLQKETHLYFGVNEGCRLTSDDYMGVMTDLGFTPAVAASLYPELMDISRKLSRKRSEERSILIG
ncbi:MAG TPA: hypothetical protein P5277_00290 [Candidatus Paceibacterota bacterium]|nr:hypothetical protein [Candidatus Paceibacterota bacterium]